MKIAICDDNRTVIEQVEQYIEIINDRSIEYEVFFCAEELHKYIEKYEKEFDVFILDIEMKEMSGIDFAKKLREKNTSALIVFMTSYSQYVFDVFETITFNFIEKPLTFEKIKKVLKKTKKYLGFSRNSFSFTYRKNSYNISFSNISYFEKDGRKFNDLTALQSVCRPFGHADSRFATKPASGAPQLFKGRGAAAGRVRDAGAGRGALRTDRGGKTDGGRRDAYADAHGAGRHLRGHSGGQPGSKKPGDRDGRNGRDGTAHPLQKPAAAGRSAGRRPRGSAAKPRGGHGGQILRAGPAGGASDAAFAAGKGAALSAHRGSARAGRRCAHAVPPRRAGGISGLRAQRSVPGAFAHAAGRNITNRRARVSASAGRSAPSKRQARAGRQGGKRWNVNIQAV